MKVFYALILVFSSLMLCQAQDNDSPKRAPDEAYTRQLVRLITELQKNPWAGWESGTEAVVRYFVDSGADGRPLGHAQPDIVYKVSEADKLLVTTQVAKGKTIRRDFLIKDQPGLDAAWPRVTDPRTTVVEIDGFTLASLLSELTMIEFPSGSRVTKEWVLAGHPSVVLRKEVNGGDGWRVTSAHVIKKIGDSGFQCVEIKKWMRFYSHGPKDVVTTQYLSPDVPGHLVEEIQEFFKVKQGQRNLTPYQVVHQKVVGLKLQNPRAPNNGLHPTRDTSALIYLQGLGRAGDAGL